MSLEIDVSEDKRQSGWQCQEGKCNRENKSLGRCFFWPEIALRSLKTARGSERGDRLEQVACQAADLALEMTEDALRKSIYVSEAVRLRSMCHGSGPSVVPELQIPLLDHQALGGTTKAAKGG